MHNWAHYYVQANPRIPHKAYYGQILFSEFRLADGILLSTAVYLPSGCINNAKPSKQYRVCSFQGVQTNTIIARRKTDFHIENVSTDTIQKQKEMGSNVLKWRNHFKASICQFWNIFTSLLDSPARRWKINCKMFTYCSQFSVNHVT